MGLTLAKCQACGAELNMETDNDHLYCPYCGSRIIKQSEKIVVETVTRTVEEHVNRIENTKDFVKLKRIEALDKYFNPSQEVYERREKEAAEKRSREKIKGSNDDLAMGAVFIGMGIFAIIGGVPTFLGGMFVAVGIAALIHSFVSRK